MALTRTVRGLDTGFFDGFSVDSIANYTANSGTWEVSTGELRNTGAAGTAKRNSITTAKCVTGRCHITSDASRMMVQLALTDDGNYGSLQGYICQYWNSTLNLTRSDWTNLATVACADFSNSGNGMYSVSRILLGASGALKVYMGATALGDYSCGATDTTYPSGFSSGCFTQNGEHIDWLDVRPAHTVIVTDLPAGSSIVCSDGTTPSDPVNTSSGTATADCGAVLFPLATITVYDDVDGTGNVLDVTDVGDYADMGGGDVYEYTSDVQQWYGEAHLLGAGSITADGFADRFGAAALRGIGSLAAAGIKNAIGRAHLVGIGSLSADGFKQAVAACHLLGVGTFTGDGFKDTFGAAALSGTGILVANGYAIRFGAADLRGIGALQAAGYRVQFSGAALLGEGIITAEGIKTAMGICHLLGIGTLHAIPGAARKYGAAHLLGEGVLEATGFASRYGAAALLGIGTLEATGEKLFLLATVGSRGATFTVGPRESTFTPEP